MMENPGLIEAHALYYTAPSQTELRRVNVPFMAAEKFGECVLIKAQWSGISRGTERLVYQGRIPSSEYCTMRAPFQEGEFPFPVKYGYSCVGSVEEGPPEMLGRHVFVLHPHQDFFRVPIAWVTALPDEVPPRRAILTANMETALNAVWDAGALPGDRIAVVGAGALGLLIAGIVSQLPGAEVAVADINEARKPVAAMFGARFVKPDDLLDYDADVVFHTSASEGGLAASIGAAGFEARIVEASWYGDGAISAILGGSFHSKRLRLISTQVGAVSNARRARWTAKRRVHKALDLLAGERFDHLITGEVSFRGLPEAMPKIFDPDPSSIVTAVRYGAV